MSLLGPSGYSHKISPNGEVTFKQHSSSCSWVTHVHVSSWTLVINWSPLLPRVLKICDQIFIVAASLEPVTIFQSWIIPVHLRRWSLLINVLSCWITRVTLTRCNSRVSCVSLLWKSIQVFHRRWKCYRVSEWLYPWCCSIRTLQSLIVVNWPITTNCILVNELVVAATSLHACLCCICYWCVPLWQRQRRVQVLVFL